MAVREELVIRTYNSALVVSGASLLNKSGIDSNTDPEFIPGYKITEYTLTLNRMGMPTLTATLYHERCLDDEWTGREYVICHDEIYYLIDTPSSSKDNTDARYKHSLEFRSEREILNQVKYFDVVTNDAGKDYKPITNSTEVKFYGTAREFAARLNCSLVYCGIGDSILSQKTMLVKGVDTPIGDGFCFLVDEDGGYDLDNVVEIIAEGQYVWGALVNGCEKYNIPFVVNGRQTVIGEAPVKVDHVFEYGFDNELLSVSKENAHNLVVNEATAVGSSENIPYYYPNETEYGHIVLELGMGNRVLTQLDMVDKKKLQLLVSRTRENTPIVYHNEAFYDATISQYYSLYHIPLDEDEPRWDDDCVVGHSVNFFSGAGTVDAKFSIHVNSPGTHQLAIKGKLWVHPNETAEITDFVGEGRVRAVYCNGAKIEQDNSAYPGIGSYGYSIKLTFAEAGDYTLECSIRLDLPEFGMMKLTEVGISTKEVNSEWWQCGDKKYYSIGRLGVELVGVKLGPSASGDSFVWKGINRMPFAGKLMPPKYRMTQGQERFYKALNNVGGEYASAYLDENGNPYEFPHPYQGNPSQYIYEYEDEKPTIAGIHNTESQLFGEIADIAYDLDDNDSLKAGTNENATTADYEHSFFYIRLHRLNYVNEGTDYSLDLFNMASQNDPMTIQMTSGRCAGCKFKIQAVSGTGEDSDRWYNPVQVDENGDIVEGNQDKKISKKNLQPQQQNSATDSIWIAVQKDVETFGEIMPNRSNGYFPEPGDKFNIINIDLPQCYIIDAERRLEKSMMADMYKDNEEHFAFDIKNSRIFFKENPDVLDKVSEYSIIKVSYNGKIYDRYVSSLTIECKDSEALPDIKFDLVEELKTAGSIVQRTTASALSHINAKPGAQTAKQSFISPLATTEDKTTTWSEVKSKPTTIEGYGIGDVKIDGDMIQIGRKTIIPLTSTSNIDWAKLINKPSTIYGYGIIDAKIENGVITLGPNSITPITEHQSLSGYATQLWVEDKGYITQNTADDRYLTKDTFHEYFVLDESGYIRALKGFYSDSFVSAQGRNAASGGGAAYSRLDAWADYGVGNEGYVLSAKLGYDLHSRVNGLTTSAVNWDSVYNWYVAMTGTDTDTVINKWSEVVSFLSGISQTETLDSILEGISSSIAQKADSSALSALSGRVSKLENAGFATESWVENKNYLTQQTAANTYLTKADFNTYFEKDADGNIRAKHGFYSDSFVSAQGLNSAGGGGGVGYNRLDNWADYNSAKNGWVVSAKAANDIYTALGRRLSAVEGAGFITGEALRGYATQAWVEGKGYLTAVSWADVSGKPAWIGASKPTYAFGDLTVHPTTLGGYGITDAKIVDGVITLGTSTIKPLTSHQSLDAYAKKDGSNASGTWGISISGNAATATNATSATKASKDGDGNVITSTYLTKAVFESYFEKDANGYIRAKAGFYSDSFVSAQGVNSAGGGSGMAYNRLDNWADRNATGRDSYVLSVKAAKELSAALSADITSAEGRVNSSISSLSGSISSVEARVSGLETAGLVTNADLTTALTNYATQTWVEGKGYITNSALSGYVTTVKVGTVSYSPTSHVVSLPAYPTTLPASDVPAWAKAANKPAYTTSEVTEGTNLYYTDARVAAKVTKAYVDALGVAAATAASADRAASADNAATATNATSATKLTTSRTLWGQNFDGTANVTGTLSDVSSIYMSGNIICGTNNILWNHANGNFSLNANGGDLYIGYINTSKIIASKSVEVGSANYVRIGDAYITYDATNQALRVSANSNGTGAMALYATGAVSAQGIGSSSGGGSSSLTVYNYDNLEGPVFNKYDTTNTYNAYAIQRIYERAKGANTSCTNLASRLTAIEGNYLPTTGGTITGSLNVNGGLKIGTSTSAPAELSLQSVGGTIKLQNSDNGVIDLLCGNAAIYEYDTDTHRFMGALSVFGSASATGSITASSFIGNLTGNATSATKATQDGDGNVITSTYMRGNGVSGAVDWNAVKTNGTYYVSYGSTNKPDNYGEMLVMHNGDTTGQLYIPYNSHGSMLYRGSSNTDGFYDWRTIVDNHNIGNYALPLSGGTLTGALTVNDVVFGNMGSKNKNAAAFLLDKLGSGQSGVGGAGVTDTIKFGACNATGAWVDSIKQKWIFNGNVTADTFGVTTITGNTTSIGGASVGLKLSSLLTGIEINSTAASMKAVMWMTDTGFIEAFHDRHSTTQAYYAYDYSLDSNWFSGSVTAQSLTNSSDARLKDITAHIDLDVAAIAAAPIVEFNWKNGGGHDVGTLAQYWQGVLSPVVKRSRSDMLSMDYGKTALIGTVTVARKVVNHEQRIRDLEAENKELKHRVEELSKTSSTTDENNA